jgi:hypothetical protein
MVFAYLKPVLVILLNFLEPPPPNPPPPLAPAPADLDSEQSILDSLIGVYTTALYFLYFVVVKNTLAIFDCSKNAQVRCLYMLWEQYVFVESFCMPPPPFAPCKGWCLATA